MRETKIKAYLNKRISKENLPTLMKTLSEGDEPILQNILDKVIFKQVENVEEEHL